MYLAYGKAYSAVFNDIPVSMLVERDIEYYKK